MIIILIIEWFAATLSECIEKFAHYLYAKDSKHPRMSLGLCCSKCTPNAISIHSNLFCLWKRARAKNTTKFFRSPTKWNFFVLGLHSRWLLPSIRLEFINYDTRATIREVTHALGAVESRRFIIRTENRNIHSRFPPECAKSCVRGPKSPIVSRTHYSSEPCSSSSFVYFPRAQTSSNGQEEIIFFSFAAKRKNNAINIRP